MGSPHIPTWADSHLILSIMTSGVPPLLKSFLQDRLGIHLIRKQPVKVKHHMLMPRKESRKVNLPSLGCCDAYTVMEQLSVARPAVSPGSVLSFALLC